MPDMPLDRPEKYGLPATPFLYHLDQVATILGRELDDLIDTQVYFASRTRGKWNPRQLKAINIAPDLEGEPEWRISEGELIRWFKLMGFRVYSRGKIV